MKILDYKLDDYQALLFDFDGTLVDSMPHHNKAWLTTLEDFGAGDCLEILMETTGMASTRIVGIINERRGLKLDPAEVAREKRNRYLKNLDQIQLVGPVMDIVKNYQGKKPMGIITGSSHEVVDQLLPMLNVQEYFGSIICSDDTVKGKDSTEPYFLASDQLKVDVTKCLFFDDGDVGLRGAKLSGMDVVHVDITKTEVFIA